MKLYDYAKGRDNNFNLIRISAAYLVLVTHSFALAIGSGDAEPFRNILGMTIGTIAVDTFFITSGFLVTASIISRQSTIEFLWARFLRIYPGMLIMLILTVFIMGPIFSNLSIIQYLYNTQTYKYFARCALLVFGVSYELPGVFTNNPYKIAVNGSLWTLPVEIRMYAILAIMWLSLKLFPNIRMAIYKVLITIIAFSSFIYVVMSQFQLCPKTDNSRLLFMFFCGASFYIYKDKIILSKYIFIPLFSITVISLFSDYFFLAYIVSLAYIIIFIAYIPAGIIRKYNKLGDYSYGMYIYAFPIQQMIASVVPGISVLHMIIFATIFVFLASILSWYLVEKRFLQLKDSIIKMTKKLIQTDRETINQSTKI
jgi:peptidoglycan/LPS O-acetylase OafA/YrhL